MDLLLVVVPAAADDDDVDGCAVAAAPADVAVAAVVVAEFDAVFRSLSRFTRSILGNVVLLLLTVAFSLLFSKGGMLITEGTLLTTLLMVLFSEILPLMCLGSV